MKFILSFIACLALYVPTYAQSDISTLLSDLKKEKTDSGKIERYKAVYEYYKFTNPDSAQYYADEALADFKRKDYKNGIAAINVLLASLDAVQGRLDQARGRYNEALKLFEEINNRNGVASVLGGLGVMEGRASNYDAAVRYFLKSLKEYESVNNKRGIVNTYLKLGNVYDANGNLDKALEYFHTAEATAKKENFIAILGYLYNNMGITYFKKGDNRQGFLYLEQALELSQRPEDAEIKILSLNNLGNAYNTIGKPERALEYYNQALQMPYIDKMPENKARLMLNVAAITCETDYKGALKSLYEALELSKSIKHRRLQHEIMDAIIEISKGNGDYKTALEMTELDRALADSIFNVEKAKEIANLQSTYDLGKTKEKVQKLQKAERKNYVQRNTIIFIAVIFFLTLVMLTLQYRKADKINIQLNKRKKELQKANDTKDRIFSIIGHDLRSPIANIPMVIELLQNPTTTEEESKYMLHLLNENAMASLDTLDKLLHWGKAQIKGTAIRQTTFNANAYIQNKLKLLKAAATNKNIRLTNNVDDDVNVFADLDHFKFVMRNLLSNAIKFSHRDSEVEINADTTSKPGFTVFSVKDSGVGIEKDRQRSVFEAFGTSKLGTENEGGTSIGLMLCKEFITENGGSIWLESEPGKGTTFYFSLKNAA